LRVSLIVLGIGRIQEKHRGGGAGIEALLVHAAQQIAHAHGNIAEVDADGQGDSHLWHTVQWSATSDSSSQCRIDTPRRVCSS